MLLFVVDTQLDEPGQPAFNFYLGKQLLHMLVDMAAVGQHVSDSRAAEQAALVARQALTGSVIITVEEKPVLRVERAGKRAKKEAERCPRKTTRYGLNSISGDLQKLRPGGQNPQAPMAPRGLVSVHGLRENDQAA
jgi:hypothetical protein